MLLFSRIIAPSCLSKKFSYFSKVDALTEAINAGRDDLVDQLLYQHPDWVNAQDSIGNSMLMLALNERQPWVAGVIIRHRRRFSSWELAACGLEGDLRKQLDENPASIHEYSPDGYPLVYMAALFGQDVTLKLLLERGANPNALAKNPSKMSALHAAALENHPEAAKLLIRYGTALTHCDCDGKTAAQLAEALEHYEVLKAFDTEIH